FESFRYDPVEFPPKLVRQSLVGRVAQKRATEPQVSVGLLVEQVRDASPCRRRRRGKSFLAVEPRDHAWVKRKTEHRGVPNHCASFRGQGVYLRQGRRLGGVG